MSVFRRDCYAHGVPVKSARIFGEWVNRTPVRRRVRIHAFPKGPLKLFCNLRDWVNTRFANPLYEKQGVPYHTAPPVFIQFSSNGVGFHHESDIIRGTRISSI